MKFIRILLLIILCFLFIGCENQDSKNGQVRLFVFDTIIDITINDHFSENLETDITEELNRLEQKFSRYIETSEISQINNNAGMTQVVSDEVLEILDESLNYANMSDGMFDITLGPIIDLWQIGTEMENVPSNEALEALLPFVDYNLIEINGNEVLLKEEMSLDLGGILKGYAADQVKKIFDRNDVQSGIINLGGNVYVHGMNDDKDWRVGIRNPYGDKSEYIGILSVSDKSVVTSGPYERFFMKDGIRYHHILNPYTGFPVENDIESVTIVSDRSIDGDALTTTLYALGVDKGLKLIQTIEGVDCIIVTKNNTIIITDGLDSKFVLTNNQFALSK